MADKADVEAALALLVGNILYPAGPDGAGGYDMAAGYGVAGGWGNPAAMQTSAAGLPVRVYRGWPVAQQLDPDLAAGVAHVTVFEQPGMSRLGDGSLDADETVAAPSPSLTATVAGAAVIFGGTAAVGQIAGVAADGASYARTVQPGDTPLAVAAAIAAMMGGGVLDTDAGQALTDEAGDTLFAEAAAAAMPAAALTSAQAAAIDAVGGAAALAAAGPAGAVLLVPTSRPLLARVVAAAVSVRRSRQQAQGFRVTCWAPSSASRDAICALIDATLSDTRWLQLPDQRARLLWRNTVSDDVTTKARLWKRDLMFVVTFWTTVRVIGPTLLFGDPTLNGTAAIA